MTLRTKMMLGAVVVATAGAVVALLSQNAPTAQSSSPPPLPVAAAKRAYSPEELLRAIIEGQIDPHTDGDLIRAILSAMDPTARARWMAEIAELIGGLDPAAHGQLQRRMGFFALDTGDLEAGWIMLKRLMECSTCAPRDRDDALRLLDQYTPGDDARHTALTDRVSSRAREILNDPSRDTAALPLVWSSMTALRHGGRLAEAVEMRTLYLDRFTGVIDGAAVATARQNLAHDLEALGRIAEAAPHFLAVAESYRSAAMSDERADYLVHAARAGQPGGATEFLEGSVNDLGERVTHSSALVFLELFDTYLRAGNPGGAASAATRFWDARSGFAPTGASGPAPRVLEYQAMLFYRASELARSQGRTVDANMWAARAVGVAPASTTAAAIRRALEAAGR
ncbi:MAG: hypothetical protein Q8L55_12495 [Phycisphaerales bacterium]|nr:hypothetical protein [Phycisphaerales bacterium]